MNYVLDACAIIAFLRDEPGADVVGSILRDPANSGAMHAVNFCEIYYDFLRASNAKTAKNVVRDVSAIGIKLRKDVSQPFWMEVGRLKASIRQISLADCFAVALALKLNAAVVTSDNREFDPLVTQQLVPVQFIR